MSGEKLLAGWATRDITPEKPVAIMGQFYDRFSKGVLDPITVTALALESLDEQGILISQSIMVSCDICMIPVSIQKNVKRKLCVRLKDFNSENLFLAATHIHTGPYLSRYFADDCKEYVFAWPTYNKEIMTPEEYSEYMENRICDAAEAAWKSRQDAGVSHRLGHSGIAHNRRVVYDDGTARMYGSSDTISYRGPEGPSDNGVELLYLWNQAEELTGVIVNVACPSQVIEHMYYISPDYWGEVRKLVKKTYGENVHVFAMCGAAGDLSPRDLVRRGRGEKDRNSIEGMIEVAENLLNTIQFKYEAARQSINKSPVVKHSVKMLPLPLRSISKIQYEKEKARYESLVDKYELNEKPLDKNTMPFSDQVALYEAERTLARYRQLAVSPVYNVEAHFVRVGDIVIATNPFELYTVYGLMIKARSVAEQTFISQLSCDACGYLATEKAIEGGHYSTTPASGKVGPQGGQLLVDYSVQYINELF